MKPGVVHSALALGGFAIGCAEFAAMSLLPSFSGDLGVDAPTGGHAISAYALGVVIGAPLLAIVGTRFRRKTWIVALMGLYALANAASAFAPTFDVLVVSRMLAGLPHGAYFGAAALSAVSLVPLERRTAAVGRVMSGLAVATIIGVPIVTVIGRTYGWRFGFGAVAAVAAVSTSVLALIVPHAEAGARSSVMQELGALRRVQVWLALGTGTVGFGGLFAVYAYLASTLDAVTHAAPATVPFVFAVFGMGMAIGNVAIARFADRDLPRTVIGLLVWSALTLILYPLAAATVPTIMLAVFAIGLGGALGTVLQTRLMDVAGDAQSLAAALHHSAFNVANAIGPWLGGLAIAAGYGWTATGWVGSLLALGGLAIWLVALMLERRVSRRHPAGTGTATSH